MAHRSAMEDHRGGRGQEIVVLVKSRGDLPGAAGGTDDPVTGTENHRLGHRRSVPACRSMPGTG